ncbi:NFACT family protein [Deinococcus lacus]|uniref:NFACT family protein n=1 Tax=Deinococcus lacus TaxID=392561 RepID=A0ABW1YD43_9DEIO
MEGLMLSRALRELEAFVPARNLGWVFPDETTAALLLEGTAGTTNLVLAYRPPQPVAYLTRERLRGEPHNAFQRTLASRVRGDLLGAEQLKLDRVFQLHFGATGGFLDQPPVRLLFEVTGRNANLLLLEAGEEFAGRILLAAREIPASRNRFRTTRSGGEYVPPPPYQKFDPRTLTPEQARSLAELPASRWRERVDGLGPLLSAELERRAAALPQLGGAAWQATYQALQSLVADPSVSEGAMQEGAREAARADKAATLRRALREPLEKRLTLLENQLGDVARAEQGLEETRLDREEADILMAYSYSVPAGAEAVTLPDLTGLEQRTLELDPLLSAVQNAEKRYARARRRDEVYARLAERKPGLRAELQQVQQQLLSLEQADLTALERLAADLRTERAGKPAFGLRYVTPGGHEVLVGRNNKENAALTHRVARSTDYWFHVQGYPGSHVVVRTGGKELAQPDILYAAALAATHSKARGSGNVPVDYTRIKHVWKPRGAPAGQVHYTDQKTVFVDGTLPV